jgi:putative ABC transport system permease protein
MEDVEIIAHEIPGIILAPEVSTTQTVVYANVNHSASVLGTTNNYFLIRNFTLDRGRLFEAEEIERSATVCILGSTVAETMFGRNDPLGNTLRVGRTSCEVVGILNSKGASFGQDQDDMIVMPTGTVQSRILGDMAVPSIQISAIKDGTTANVKLHIESLLRDRRGVTGKEDDFFVRDMQEVADTLEGTTRTLTMLLGAIAAISLLVGGIGIMNIMLVSVTERTREIGIRIAIGAQVKDVLIQFLVEAVALSCLGGALGVVVGIAGTHFATQAMDLPFVLSMDTILIGFGFSAFVGVVFGFFPARKAANLNPIEALRHE